MLYLASRRVVGSQSSLGGVRSGAMRSFVRRRKYGLLGSQFHRGSNEEPLRGVRKRGARLPGRRIQNRNGRLSLLVPVPRRKVACDSSEFSSIARGFETGLSSDEDELFQAAGREFDRKQMQSHTDDPFQDHDEFEQLVSDCDDVENSRLGSSSSASESVCFLFVCVFI